MTNSKTIPPQDCGIGAAPSVARRPKGNLKRKPEVEWVVQLGPLTNGSITAPELVRPLEGPTDWLIKPRNGAIEPFDTASPTPKNVVRKYLNVGAQEDEAPRDLPKLSDGYVVGRNQPDALPDLPGKPKENGLPSVNNNFPADRIVTERVEVPVTRVVEREVPGETIIKYRDVIKYIYKCPPKCDDDKDPPKCEDKDPCKPDDVCKPIVDAKNDSATTKMGTPVTIDVLRNDTGKGALKIESASSANGTVEIKDGKLIFTPKDGFKGDAKITYTISDKGCGLDSADVRVDVKEPPKPSECIPVVDAKDDKYSTLVNKSITMDVLKNDSGNGALKIESATATNGTVEIKDGKLIFIPKDGFNGDAKVTYTISDKGCGTDTANVQINVNKPPECIPKVDAKDDRAETTVGKPVTIDVLKNDEGVGKLKIESASADHGTVKIEGDKLLYTPKAGFEGKDTITYKITDQGCGSDDACVVVKVKDNVVDCPPPKPTCPTPVSEDCHKSECEPDVKVSSHDYSTSSKVLFENAVADSRDEMDQIIFENKSSVAALKSGQSWGESTYAEAHSANTSHVAPEPELAAA